MSGVDEYKMKDGSIGFNMAMGWIKLYDDHLVITQGVLRPVDTPISYSSIISVSSTDGGGVLSKNAYIQINTAGQSYSITAPGGMRGYDDVADRIRGRISKAKEKAKQQTEEQLKAQAESQAKIIAQTVAEIEAKARKEAEERIKAEKEAEKKLKASKKTTGASNVQSLNSIRPYFSVADEILKFKNLLDMGIISSDDFERKKNELLSIPLVSVIGYASSTNEVEDEENMAEQNDASTPQEADIPKNIYLISIPNSSDKTKVMYAISGITGITYWEAETFVSSLPRIIRDSATSEEIKDITKKLEKAGAIVEVR